MRLTGARFPSVRTVFARFVIHYIVLLLVLSCAAAFLYHRSVQYAEREAMESGLAKLDKTRELVDARLKEVESLTTQLSLDTRVRHFLSAKKPYSGDDIIRIKEIADSLATYRYSNRFISDIFLYLNNETLISSVLPTTNVSLQYGLLLAYDGLDYAGWRDRLLGAYHYSAYWPESRVRLGQDRPEVLTYVQSVPIGAVHTYKGALVALIDAGEVRKLLATVVDDGKAWSYVEDAEGRMLTGLNRTGSERDRLLLPEGKRGYVVRDREGEKQLVMYAVSAESGWKYVAGVPYDSVISNVRYMKTMYQTTMGIAIVAGLLIAVAFSYSSSRPILQIIRKLRQGLAETSASDKSEYAFLAGTITQLLENRDAMRSDLAQQQELVRATFFERLLRGGFSREKEIDSVRSYIGLDLPEGAYAAVLVAIDAGRDTDMSHRQLERLDTAKVLVRRIFMEKLPYPMKDYSIDHDKLAVLLAIEGAAWETVRNELSDTVSVTAGLLLQSCGTDILVGIGSPCQGLIQIRNSFEEAAQALDSLGDESPGPLAFHADLVREKDDYYYPLDIETRLINLVKAGDRTEAAAVLGQLRQTNREHADAGTAFATIEPLAFELRGTAVKLRKSFAAVPVRDGDRPDWPIESLRGDLSVDELFDRAEALFLSMCEWIGRQKNDRQKALAEQMLRLVETHYLEDDWSLYKFAEDLGMTEKYASQLFKDLTGHSFSQYLEMKRMEQAVRLLRDQAVSVSDISRMCGYANPNTFYKAFKRCFGVSPTVYRQALPAE